MVHLGGVGAVDVEHGVARPVGRSSATIAEELRMLPRGRGVLSDDLDQRIGPLLRELCGVGGADDAGAVRRKVAQRLAGLVGRLPEDLGHAVRMALALDGSATDRFLKDRVGQLATVLQRDPRTAKRRVDEGLRRLAEMIMDDGDPGQADRNTFVPDGWYIKSLHANLLLDRDPPQLIERRRIVATTDVDTVVATLSASAACPQGEHRAVRMDVLQGGALLDESHLAGGHYQGIIRLPVQLTAGTSHEYTVLFTAHSRRYLLTYYALTPFRRCDRFELAVRFDPAGAPGAVWRLDGFPPRVIHDVASDRELLDIDPIGEAHATFTHLRPGLSYGIRWSGQLPGMGAVLEAYG
jgi:hypothetical protein